MSRGLLLLLLVTAAAWLTLGLGRVRPYDSNLTAVVGFGCHPSRCLATENRAHLPDRAVVYESGGYDGQFFYVLASALYGPGRFPPALDDPAFRLSRIGYPLLTGPWLLLGRAWLLPGMLASMLLLHLVGCALLWQRLAADRRGRLMAWVFALNPISMLCFVLLTADAFAVGLAILGWHLFAPPPQSEGAERPSPSAPTGSEEPFPALRRALRTRAALLVAWLCFALALLSKETMLALVGALVFAELIRGVHRWPQWSGSLGRVLFLLSTLVPLLVWWRAVRFSPGVAADRGGPPLAGLIGYLTNDPDALLAPRSFLVALFICGLGWVVWILANADRLFANAGQSQVRTHAAQRVREQTMVGVGMLLAALLPILFATADEYWGNTANIARMFLLVVLSLALLGAQDYPGAGVRRASLARGLGWTAAVLILGLSLVQFQRTFRAEPLRYQVLDQPSRR